MKKLLITSVLSSALILAACGSEEESTESTDNSAEVEQLQEQVAQLEEENTELKEQLDNATTVVEEESEESESDSVEIDNESSRTNPLTLGETTEVKVVTYNDEVEELQGIANVTVDNVVRGQEALDALDTGDMYTEAPEDESLEYIVFDLTYELTEFEDEDYPVSVMDDVEIYTEDGSNVDQSGYMTWVDGEEFPVTELYEGGTASGKVVRVVPIDEPFLIKFDDYMYAEAWYQVD